MGLNIELFIIESFNLFPPPFLVSDAVASLADELSRLTRHELDGGVDLVVGDLGGVLLSESPDATVITVDSRVARFEEPTDPGEGKAAGSAFGGVLLAHIIQLFAVDHCGMSLE